MSSSSRKAETAPRTQQACRRCRAKKSRCDAGRPSCGGCTAQGQECVYDSAPPRRRGPGRSKQAVLALEERLAQMESTLRRAGLAAQSSSLTDDASPTPEAQAAPSPSPIPLAAQPQPEPSPAPVPVPAPAPPRQSDHDPPSESPVASLLPDFVAARMFLTKPAPVIEGPTFPRRTYTPDFDRQILNTLWLPLTPSVAAAFPVLNADCLVGRFQGGGPAADALIDSTHGWAYACACMALGSSLKCLNEAIPALFPRIWPWFMNAVATIAELTTTATDPLAVQALVGMAVFMQGSAASSAAVALAASAATLSNRLGLHRDGGNDDPVRDRIFWAAYILDKSNALNLGVPSAIPDDDIEADLPPPDIFWLRLRAQLATIQSRIHTSLYTAHALALPGPEVFRAVLDAERIMDSWRRTLPGEMADAIVEGGVGGDADELTGAQLDVVMTFNTCQILVHWSSCRMEGDLTLTVGVGGKESAPQSMLLPRGRHCLLRCRSGATAVMRAFCSVSAPPLTVLWRMVCHPLCAMIVLLVDILEEPATTQSTKLLQIVKSFTTFLETFQREEKCDLAKLIAASGTLLWVAQAAVQRARDGTDVVVPEGTAGVAPEKLLSLLRSATSPMTLAQALIGNQPTRDSVLAAELIAMVACPDYRPIGVPLAPDALCPSTYGFHLDGGM